MDTQWMNLKVLLPFRVFGEEKKVRRIVAESEEGFFGFLPNRLDCVLALIPGILTYETEDGQVRYLAIEKGILVKEGNHVAVSVRNAIGDAPLGELRQKVDQELKTVDEAEVNLHAAMAKLESSFIRQFEKLKKQ